MAFTHSAEGQARSELLSGLLFLIVLLFFIVSLSPFPSLSVTYAGEAQEIDSALPKQLVAVGLVIALMVFVRQARSADLLMQLLPGTLLVFGWFGLTSVLGLEPSQSLRRLVMAGILCASAAAMLLVPRDERHFAKLLAICASIVIVVSYVGVALIPDRAVHQVSDFLEPQLAGNWRGLFDHKNGAAAAMSIFALSGLYIASRLSRWVGWTLTVLALIFLIQTGGKTAAALFPVVLILTAIIERAPALRYLAVVGILVSMAILTIGAVLFPQVKVVADALGVDTTFTSRTDIWTLAIDAIRDHPIFGHGYQAFWQRDEFRHAFQEVPTWAVTATDSHNGYLEMLLAAGFPGLILLLFWIVWQPLRDLGIACRNGMSPLTRYYTRVWLYALLLGFLESTFLISAGAIWFMLLLAIFGLRLHVHAKLVAPRTTPAEIAVGRSQQNAY